MATEARPDLKRRSRAVSEGPSRAPARSMLRAVGLRDEDMDKPFVAVGNLASDVTPCNVHLDRLAARVKEGLWAANAVPFQFGTITVSDGISMGTEGMKASLVSREVIADSIETVTFAESMDGLIVVAACDKNMPGSIMAMARLNVPSLFVYGGAILPGNFRGEDVNIQDMYEAVGAYSQGRMSLDDLLSMERVACPGEGACAGMFTANTMASAIEAIGMSLPGAASIPAVDRRDEGVAHTAGRMLYNLLERDIKPRDIMTREAFENAITVVLAMGGSTNAVLHLVAMAHEARVELSIDDFDRLSRRTPYLTDLRPGGRYVMSDVDRSGGIPVVMKELLKAGLLNGDVMTVTGRTMAENLEEFDTEPDSKVIYPVSSPRSPTGGLVILKGNLAPEGAVMKGVGHQAPVPHGSRAGIRRRARRVRRRRPQRHKGRRRPGPAVRGPQGRPRHAGDARRDRRHHGPGSRQRCHAADRRPFLRRHPRPDDRPRRPRGGRGRPDRPGPRGRHHLHGRRGPHAQDRGVRRGASPAARRLDRADAQVRLRRDGQVRPAGLLGLPRRSHHLTAAG